MEVGRRILYEASTGTILYDTGEAAGDVTARPTLQGIKHLDLPYGQDLDKFMRIVRYHIDTETRVVVFDELLPPVVSQEQTIADLENQLLEVNGVI